MWLNLKEFARPHVIEGHEIICVFTSDKRAKIENLAGAQMVLFVRHEEVHGITPGQSVEIDGKIYLVKDAQDLQGVIWRVNLSGDVG